MEDDIDYNDCNYVLNELDRYHQERHKREKILQNMEAAVVLLSDLRKSNVSLEAYKKIIKWTDQFFIFNDADETKPPSWACVIKYLSKCYKLECLKPWKTWCCLPTTNLVFDLITHRLLSSIFSLFTDETLMKPGNLIFKNARKPCKLRKDRGIIGEIDSASAYQEFCKKAPEDAIVMPMIIFGDGTVIDGSMRKSLEPYSFTLAIFRQCVRALPISWHNLGYIKNKPNCLFTPAKMSAGKQYKKDNFIKDAKKLEYVSKTRLQYNAQLWLLPYGLCILQQLATGMNFRLPWFGAAGKLFTVLFPILFFMGDTPAHDKLCCLCIHPKAQFICQII